MATVSDTALMKFVQKMAKGVKGNTPLHTWKQSLQLVGWRVEDSTFPVLLNGSSKAEFWLKGWFKANNGRYFGHSRSKKGPFTVHFDGTDLLSDAERIRDSIGHFATVTKSEPTGGDVGTVFVTQPQAFILGSKRIRVDIPKVWVVLPGWIVTPRKGDPKAFTQPMSDGGRPENPDSMSMGSFWTWAYKCGLKEDAAAALAALGADTTPTSAKGRAATETLSDLIHSQLPWLDARARAGVDIEYQSKLEEARESALKKRQFGAGTPGVTLAPDFDDPLDEFNSNDDPLD